VHCRWKPSPIALSLLPAATLPPHSCACAMSNRISSAKASGSASSLCLKSRGKGGSPSSNVGVGTAKRVLAVHPARSLILRPHILRAKKQGSKQATAKAGTHLETSNRRQALHAVRPSRQAICQLQACSHGTSMRKMRMRIWSKPAGPHLASVLRDLFSTAVQSRQAGSQMRHLRTMLLCDHEQERHHLRTNHEATMMSAADHPDIPDTRIHEAKRRGSTTAARNRLKRFYRPAMPVCQSVRILQLIDNDTVVIDGFSEPTKYAKAASRCLPRSQTSAWLERQNGRKASHTIDEHRARYVGQKHLLVLA
jgi:hypothetical protein